MTGAGDDGLNELLNDPRVGVDSYIIRPSGHDEIVNSDDRLSLKVVNGHAWGWSVRRAIFSNGPAMNRKGQWVYESRGSGRNRPRRYPLAEALSLALKYVDKGLANPTEAEAS